MMDAFSVVIVGSGHGGAQAALALLQRKFGGSIAILTDETLPPYERPPLSKDYLTGKKEFERIMVRPAGFWAERGIRVVNGCRVVAIDADARQVVCEDGRRVGYGTLVWAAGGTPRRLAGLGDGLRNVHHIRTVADADRMKGAMDACTRVAIVGAGYIGLEAAAVLASAGKRVTVIEAADRVLARVAGAAMSGFVEAEHRARGVDFRLAATVADMHVSGGDASHLRLSDGGQVDCDMVLVGIGMEPAVGPLRAAGATCGNGVAVDAFCRTSLPDIFAIGDCALHANPFAGGREIRLESVQNATDMATTVARAITGDPAPYASLPWFWSDQFDLKLQTVGLAHPHDREILRGRPQDRSFSVIYTREGRVCAVDCVNSVKDYVAARSLVAARSAVPAERLRDIGTPLKALVA